MRIEEHLPSLLQPYPCRNGAADVSETDEFYARLDRSPFPAAAFDERVTEPNWDSSYLDFHRLRFQELHGLVASLDRGRPVRRLQEVSTMLYTTSLWKRHLPQLSTCDLPALSGGPTPESVASQRVDAHLEVDLNKVDLETVGGRNLPQAFSTCWHNDLGEVFNP